MTGWPTKAEPGVWLKFNLVPQKNFNFPGNIEYSIMMKILHFSEQKHPRLPCAEIYQHYFLQSTTDTTELEENAWSWRQTYIVAIFQIWYKLFIGVHQYKTYAYGINSIITIAIVSSIYNFFHVWMSWVTKSLNLASHKIILLSEINPSHLLMQANTYGENLLLWIIGSACQTSFILVLWQTNNKFQVTTKAGIPLHNSVDQQFVLLATTVASHSVHYATVKS